MKIRKQGCRPTAGGRVKPLQGQDRLSPRPVKCPVTFHPGTWPRPCSSRPPARGHFWAAPCFSIVTGPPQGSLPHSFLWSQSPNCQVWKCFGAHLQWRESRMTLLSLPGKLRAGPGQVVSEPGRQDTAWWQVAGGGSWPWGTFKGCGGRRTMAGLALAHWGRGASGLDRP